MQFKQNFQIYTDSQLMSYICLFDEYVHATQIHNKHLER